MTDRLRVAAQAALGWFQCLDQPGEIAEQLRCALAEQDHSRDATEMIDDRARIERLVRDNARRAMVIDIIERLVENPERTDFDPQDMEYWGPLHDRLRAALIAATGKRDLQVADQEAEPVAWTPLNERWCWWFDSDEHSLVEDSEDAAHDEARARIDDEYESGEEAEYFVARVINPLDRITGGRIEQWLGERIHEQVDEWCAEDSGAEDEVLGLTGEHKAALGKLVIDWMRQHAKIQWWTYDSKTQTTNRHIAGRNHD